MTLATLEHASLTLAQVLDWVDGLLPEGASTAGDDRDPDRRWLQVLGDLRRAPGAADVPAEAQAEILDQVAALAQRRSSTNPLEWLIARLAFDSASPALSAAIRSGGPSAATRQIAYATEDGDIALQVVQHERERTISIHGQFLNHHDDAPMSLDVRIMRNDDLIQSSATDAFGEFEIAGIDPGHYRLLLTSDSFNVLIPDIELAA